ncbi:methyl-accepting chemotaxis protein [Methanoplanus limicola]|uniref:Methyl-accepting chemotaxis sensory transducer with Pas/Pac sensor n=1 Tax=Methanoplanus limicola DSM 2279 TaxID=937775 RepID=H1Z0W2_9EURY|nr:methyl-accepting chemotaxis protein [Methanoplanus limicola]EHQ36255.1 methyl-accepting chemotaxis sensory transducer with Pas/Pac sensor [Methanoplanus limicola DSM 2279]
MSEVISVIVLEDSKDDAFFNLKELQKGGYETDSVCLDNAADFREALGRKEWDVIISDYDMGAFNGKEALKVLKERNDLDIPFILVSGAVGEDTAVELMKSGCNDFISKDSLSRLYPAVKREIKDAKIRKDGIKAQAELDRNLIEMKELTFRQNTMLEENPTPLILMDLNLNIKFVNRAYVKLSGYSKDKLLSMSARDFKVLEKSGQGLKEALATKSGVTGDITVEFPTGIKLIEQDTIPIADSEGNISDILAAYKDMTEIRRVNEYLHKEVIKVSENLENLAGGNLDISLEIEKPDEYTREAYENFNRINESMKALKIAVNNLVEDAGMLAEGGKNGRFDIRADISVHKGSFRQVIEGFNETLEAFIVPLNEAKRIALEYADNNFSARFDRKIEISGEFVEFAEALNNTGICLGETIAGVKEAVSKTNYNAKEVNKGTEDVGRAAEDVASTSQKTADVVEKLLVKMEDINNQIADLSASNEEIASTSQEVLKGALNVVDIGKEAQVAGDDAKHKMASVEEIAGKSVGEINSLKDQIAEVGTVVKIIYDITGQINLLALNAAIEAARAGEHGRGFAVVAGEVKNLAGEARQATDSIEKVVAAVQANSESAAAAITGANKEIITGAESVNNALEALNKIIISANQVQKDIGDITSAIENQADIANRVVSVTQEGTVMTQEVQNQSVELASLAEEASASVEEIASAVYEVTELTAGLRSEMDKFRL